MSNGDTVFVEGDITNLIGVFEQGRERFIRCEQEGEELYINRDHVMWAKQRQE
ncbi:MAG: hypothetical protein M3O91_00090 [Chloroflexota bacterium]|nr:hypothetical protein [Chloroflexota bacterium]